MSATPPSPTALRVSSLPQNAPKPFALLPNAQQMQEIAAELGLAGLRKLRFEGQIEAMGRADWKLTGKLGATVVQPCVVTLDPVTTRIDAPVERIFQHSFTTPDGEVEVEMDEDDRTEPLGAWIDPAAVMVEALSLNLPLYPRVPDAELEQTVFTEDGLKPMTDEDARPFAGLAALRGQLDDDTE
ncbi:Uncharacterized ACR, COG1399 [Pseudosulfitobacter pseudonitzschiae]|uniref:ACR n=1 Tax=Pseudosulfitobacter pseudonitzschiae TaxID=1402135 RepID=A0A073J533_9RHOB|nr:DUF177 domain-containing protein [Pseudosulfitobacter pseudonitzschiae]KEJ97733.1 hypothetical protein SUH3_01745 [Pseudosulfitobacter pseudonitzschiae]QKS09002.1 DUF177 domain-containing protein [Pseudosulfitobacter pseudonitzschiae]SHE59838.1 Uncharacterized ACR, COG1399 [Pseudosulfitobacter pseudonitzschiae]